MAESTSNSQDQASFDNQPDLGKQLPSPSQFATDIPRAEQQSTAPSPIITAADIPRGEQQSVYDLVKVDRTISGVEALRLRQASRFDEPDTDESNPNVKYGRFDGRPIIGHDTRITGGVYIGGGAREAIVVDDYRHSESTDPSRHKNEKDGQIIYDAVYARVLQEITSQTTQEDIASDDRLLKSVYSVVDQVLQYDNDFARTIAKKYKDRKVNLAYFINEHKGVCRHQALLVGYLLERLVNDGKLHGKASIQRNAIKGYGAHAWASFTAEDGTEYIVDVTQGFVGRAEDAPDNSWIYIGH